MKEKLIYGRPPYARLPMVFTSSFKSFDATNQNAKWIWLWMLFLDDNENYRSYREAKNNGDDTTCRQLEVKFPLIADIYEDWGDLTNELTSFSIKTLNWKLWLYNRRHLFFGYIPQIKIINPALIELQPHHQTLQIPTGLTKELMLELLSEFVNEQYDTKDTELEKIPPKYKLHSPNGKLDMSTYNTVVKSFYVRCCSERSAGKTRSNEAIALQIISLEPNYREKLGFGDKWARVHDAKRNKINLDSLTKMVKRLKANHKTYINNTIYGKFPCKD